MTTVNVGNTGITFANTSAANDGIIAINASSELTFDRPIQAPGGIVSSSMTIGGSGSYSANTNFDDITVGDLTIKDDSGDLITVTAPSAVTAHTLTLPSAQGSSGTYLENDGSGGLSWSAAAATTDIFPIKFYGNNTVSSGWNDMTVTHDGTNLGNTSSSAFTPSFSSGTTLSQVVASAGTYRITVQFQWKMEKNTTVASASNGCTFFLAWDSATNPTEYMKFVVSENPHQTNGSTSYGYSHQTRIVKFASSTTLVPKTYRGSSIPGLTGFVIDHNGGTYQGYNMTIEKLS